MEFPGHHWTLVANLNPDELTQALAGVDRPAHAAVAVDPAVWLVGLVITAAYWFTASTSFANPAVTLARGFTATFSGIALDHVPAFIAAQLIGAGIASLVCFVLFPAGKTSAARSPAPAE